MSGENLSRMLTEMRGGSGGSDLLKKIPYYVGTTDSFLKSVLGIGGSIGAMNDYFETRRKKKNIKNMKDFATAAAIAALPVLFSDSFTKKKTEIEKNSFQKTAVPSHIQPRHIASMFRDALEANANRYDVESALIMGNKRKPRNISDAVEDVLRPARETLKKEGPPSVMNKEVGDTLLGSQNKNNRMFGEDPLGYGLSLAGGGLATAFLLSGGANNLLRNFKSSNPLWDIVTPHTLAGGSLGILAAKYMKEKAKELESEPPYKTASEKKDNWFNKVAFFGGQPMTQMDAQYMQPGMGGQSGIGSAISSLMDPLMMMMMMGGMNRGGNDMSAQTANALRNMPGQQFDTAQLREELQKNRAAKPGILSRFGNYITTNADDFSTGYSGAPDRLSIKNKPGSSRIGLWDAARQKAQQASFSEKAVDRIFSEIKLRNPGPEQVSVLENIFSGLRRGEKIDPADLSERLKGAGMSKREIARLIPAFNRAVEAAEVGSLNVGVGSTLKRLPGTIGQYARQRIGNWGGKIPRVIGSMFSMPTSFARGIGRGFLYGDKAKKAVRPGKMPYGPVVDSFETKNIGSANAGRAIGSKLLNPIGQGLVDFTNWTGRGLRSGGSYLGKGLGSAGSYLGRKSMGALGNAGSYLGGVARGSFGQAPSYLPHSVGVIGPGAYKTFNPATARKGLSLGQRFQTSKPGVKFNNALNFMTRGRFGKFSSEKTAMPNLAIPGLAGLVAGGFGGPLAGLLAAGGTGLHLSSRKKIKDLSKKLEEFTSDKKLVDSFSNEINKFRSNMKEEGKKQLMRDLTNYGTAASLAVLFGSKMGEKKNKEEVPYAVA